MSDHARAPERAQTPARIRALRLDTWTAAQAWLRLQPPVRTKPATDQSMQRTWTRGQVDTARLPARRVAVDYMANTPQRRPTRPARVSRGNGSSERRRIEVLRGLVARTVGITPARQER